MLTVFKPASDKSMVQLFHTPSRECLLFYKGYKHVEISFLLTHSISDCKIFPRPNKSLRHFTWILYIKIFIYVFSSDCVVDEIISMVMSPFWDGYKNVIWYLNQISFSTMVCFAAILKLYAITEDEDNPVTIEKFLGMKGCSQFNITSL